MLQHTLQERLEDLKKTDYDPTDPYGSEVLVTNFAEGLETAPFTSIKRYTIIAIDIILLLTHLW